MTAPAERLRRALAEVGYPDAEVILDFEGRPRLIPQTASPEAWWRAKTVCGVPTACWPCWSADPWTFPSCDHDPLTSPWPELVR